MNERNSDFDTNELDNLFVEYRRALPEPDASVNFMPELWRKIEARRFSLPRWKKLTQFFIVAAAAICLLLGIVLEVPITKGAEGVRSNYVDVLADANPTENLNALGIRVDYVDYAQPNGR